MVEKPTTDKMKQKTTPEVSPTSKKSSVKKSEPTKVTEKASKVEQKKLPLQPQKQVQELLPTGKNNDPSTLPFKEGKFEKLRSKESCHCNRKNEAQEYAKYQ